MDVRISERGKALPASPIRKLKPYADAAIARGVKVFNVNIGQPDIHTPPKFMEMMKKFDNPVLAYGPAQGLDTYVEQLSAYYRRLGFSFSKDEIVVTQGGSEALLMAFSVVCDPGDEILIPEPFYTNYNGFAVIAQCNVVPVLTKAEDGFHLPPKEVFEKAITPRTKAIVVCSPNNPTGTVFSRDEIAMVCDLAKEHGLFIISDEAYREFIYDGEQYVSPLHFPEVADRTILVDSISKRFSSCGARIGNLCTSNKAVYGAALRFAMTRLCPATVSQHMALASLDVYDEYVAACRDEFRLRRDTVMEVLSWDPRILCKMPRGAFYVIARLPIDDADDFAIYMMERFQSNGETTLVAPAGGFYATPGMGKQEIRIAFVLSAEKMRRATEVLLEGMDAYRIYKGLK